MAGQTTLMQGTLEVAKTTENKIVFRDQKDDEPLAYSRFGGLYLDNRDLRAAGWKGEPIHFTFSIGA